MASRGTTLDPAALNDMGNQVVRITIAAAP